MNNLKKNILPTDVACDGWISGFTRPLHRTPAGDDKSASWSSRLDCLNANHFAADELSRWRLTNCDWARCDTVSVTRHNVWSEADKDCVHASFVCGHDDVNHPRQRRRQATGLISRSRRLVSQSQTDKDTPVAFAVFASQCLREHFLLLCASSTSCLCFFLFFRPAAAAAACWDTPIPTARSLLVEYDLTNEQQYTDCLNVPIWSGSCIAMLNKPSPSPYLALMAPYTWK